MPGASLSAHGGSRATPLLIPTQLWGVCVDPDNNPPAMLVQPQGVAPGMDQHPAKCRPSLCTVSLVHLLRGWRMSLRVHTQSALLAGLKDDKYSTLLRN